MKVLLQGSIWTEPAREPHYVWVKDGEVVIQVVGCNGPSSSTPTKPRVMARIPPNPSFERTSTSALRALASAAQLQR